MEPIKLLLTNQFKGMKKTLLEKYLLFPKIFQKQTMLAALLLIVNMFQLNAADSSKENISLSFKDATLDQVLHSIEEQSGFKFFYQSSAIDLSQHLSIQVSNASVDVVLKQLFRNREIDYKIKGDQIVLKKKIKSTLTSSLGGETQLSFKLRQFQIYPPADVITGKVLDEEGAPLPGVNIVEKGTTNGTNTDANGDYSLKLINSNTTLIFSFIGYAAKEIAVNGQTTINVSLAPDIIALSEVVVIGYQTVKRKDLTDAVSVVDAKDARRLTATTVGEALQGLATGVTVRSGGRPGQESIIEIRGVGSLVNNNPFYVIDGLPSTIANRDFNPNDIESIQILKDASAAAIYGARAANGVIIITTKKGAEGPLKVNFSAKYGMQRLPKRWNLTNNIAFAELNRTAYENGGAPPMASVSSEFNPNINTDWQDAVMQNGSVQDYDLSFSGGSKTSSYFISGNYFKNYGTIIGTAYDRVSLRVNSEGKKGRFKIGENLAIVSSDEDQMEGNPFIDMVRLLPVIPINDPNNPGGYGYGSDKAYTFGTNPVALNELRQSDLRNVRIRGNAYAEFEIASWIRYRFNMALETNFDHFSSFRKTGSWTYNQPVEQSLLNETRSQTLNTLTEHTLNINKKIGERHMVDAVLGFNFQKDRFENIGATKLGFTRLPNGDYLPVLDQGATPTFAGGSVREWASYSVFGRVNYNFAERYFLSATLRRDADSRFNPTNRTGYFPSAAVAWRISNEDFFQIDFINDLKLRASYGRLGNVTIGSYQYVGTINPNPRYVFNDAPVLLGSSQTELVNEDLKWEDKSITNIGIDASFMSNTISLSAEYYKSISKDVLTYDVPFPRYLGGTGNPPVNAASMQNTGVEVSLTYRNNNFPVKFDVTGNFTTIKNEILELGNLGEDRTYIQRGLTRSEIGRSVGEYYGLKTNGIFQNAAEVAAHGVQPYSQPGDIRYVNANGDDVIDNDDRVYLGSPWPKLQSGLIINATYKSFGFSVQIYGSYGQKIFNTVHSIIDKFDDNSNYRTGITPWTPEAPDTDFPRIAYSSDPAIQMNTRGDTDRWLESGSFTRLRNLEVSYQFPADLLKKVSFENARIYVSGQNLFTLTKYNGLDPDVVGTNFFERTVDAGNFPATRIFSVGLQCGF
jgi:TonB-linked SusC/RagA family outer membrane protein